MSRRVLAVLIVALGMLGACVPSQAFAHDGGAAHPDEADAVRPAPSDPARGLVYTGLTRGEAAAACDGLFALESAPGQCTHGPDPASAGRDVRIPRLTQEVADSAARLRRVALAEQLADPQLAAATGDIVCDGDGVTGKRVQALYVVASDRPDRFDAVAPSLVTYAVAADATFARAAEATGGARHLRFVTKAAGAGCGLDVRTVVVGAAADDSMNATISAVRALGWNRADRKYLMWVDASVYCGIASIYDDDQPGQANTNNGSFAQFARVDTGCWGGSTEAHEVMHNLGGVQTSAPNATTNRHCSDEWDLMCYDDGSGVPMRYVCASSQAVELDCGKNDYFNVDPPTGSYLATRWNTANSAFLIGMNASTVSRLSGPDRYATAVAMGRESAPTATTVVVTSGEQASLVDGLTAGPLAAAAGAPLLLTRRDGLPDVVADDLADRGADRAYVVGGTGAVSAAVVDRLTAAGIAVTRLAGPSRYETAAAVAARIRDLRGSDVPQTVVASGENAHLIDALPGGGLAAATGGVVLLTTKDALPPATADALDTVGASAVTVVGAVGVISDAVLAEVGGPGRTVTRAGGADRYATAAAVATLAYDLGSDRTHVVVASGADANMVDAVPAATLELPILATTRTALPAVTGAWLQARDSLTGATVAGGTGAVSEAVLYQVAAAIAP